MRGGSTSGANLDRDDVVLLDSDDEVRPLGNQVADSTYLCDGTQSMRCYDAVLSNGVVHEPFKKDAATNQLRGYMWKCECYGSSTYKRCINGKRVVAEREGPTLRKSKKCDCPVYMHCCKNKSGDWVVKGLELQHKNYVPTPRKSRFIAMYRQDDINVVVTRKLFIDVGVGSKVTQVFNSLASERNRVENVTFTKKDLRNIISRERSEKMKNVTAAGISSVTPTKKTPPKSIKKSPASSKKKSPKSVSTKKKGTVTETENQCALSVSPSYVESGSSSTDVLVNDPVFSQKPHRIQVVSSDEVPRLSAGGIEMLTEDGSVGYFTSTVEAKSDGFVLCGDDDRGVVGLDDDDLLTQHDVWI
uniref:FAR1 domain-containing protein n=1 Tax=Chenopodium quinoa TaxID=63459 RepID=A0A803LFW5_CHEQI